MYMLVLVSVECSQSNVKVDHMRTDHDLDPSYKFYLQQIRWERLKQILYFVYNFLYMLVWFRTDMNKGQMGTQEQASYYRIRSNQKNPVEYYSILVQPTFQDIQDLGHSIVYMSRCTYENLALICFSNRQRSRNCSATLLPASTEVP